KALSYSQLTPMLTKAIQELAASTTELSTKLDTLIGNGTISSNGLWTADAGGHIKLVTASVVDFQNQDLINIKNVLSSSGSWSIKEDEGTFVGTELCLDEICISKDQLNVILQNANIISSPTAGGQIETTTISTTSADEQSTTTSEFISSEPAPDAQTPIVEPELVTPPEETTAAEPSPIEPTPTEPIAE
ncbi:MAG TPA: hypothetical protein P5056_03625, partial [Candidatus Paceibacterota bacterium]|nr:hypothetical protein [Candidatus Paceibacterota bacterium]